MSLIPIVDDGSAERRLVAHGMKNQVIRSQQRNGEDGTKVVRAH